MLEALRTIVHYEITGRYEALFSETAALIPHQKAVVYKKDHVTYKELDQRSNQLARVLQQEGINSNRIVALYMEPSLELLIAILGIFKAGAAYLPIDPAFPLQRIQYILDDSQAALVLTTRKLAPKIPGGIRVIDILSGSIRNEITDPVESTGSPDEAAYIIYTSGTTGNPKGVIITQRNLLNYIHWLNDAVGVKNGDRTALTSSYAYDLGYSTLFPGLLKGAEIHLLDKEIYMDPRELWNYVHLHGMSYLKMTPTLFSLFLRNEAFGNIDLASLRLIMLGGESITNVNIPQFLQQYPEVRIMNHYGPTETTIGAVVNVPDFNTFPEHNGRSVIGRPISNTAVYIIDQDGQLAPEGVPGELFIAGTGLAAGYLNNPELTAEKFIYHANTGRKVYCTGDRGRFLPDGSIEFLGRKDNQIKIRGFRVEIAEIENRLLSHPSVTEVAVLQRTENKDEPVLYAYIAGNHPVQSKDLREYLSHLLPDYMIPAVFVFLERLPRTGNGKLDRNALPIEAPAIEQSDVPVDGIQQMLRQIWADVLQIPEGNIGMDSDFFELGGHSIKAITLSARIHKKMNVRLPLEIIFSANTVRKQAEQIALAEKDNFEIIPVAEKKDLYLASSSQRRLYILQEMDTSSTAYNMTQAYELFGQPQPDKLQSTFVQLLRRHESLRTSFMVRNGEIWQQVNSSVDFKLEYIRTNQDQLEQVKARFLRPFDLSAAPLLRAALVNVDDRFFLLLVDMHHIISDGGSMEILSKDFVSIYAGQVLPQLRLQYKDFSEWQNSEQTRKRIDAQKAFWLNCFHNNLPLLQLPLDSDRPAVLNYEGDVVAIELSKADTAALRTIAKEEDVTMFSLLMSVYHVLLSNLSGQEDIIVGTPVMGRRHADLEHIIGMFVNTICIRAFPLRQKSFVDFMAEVKATTIGAFDNQDYAFEELVNEVNAARHKNRNPLFDVMFTFRNQSNRIEDERRQGEEHEILKINPVTFTNSTSKFELSLHCTEFENNLSLQLQYNKRLFNREKVIRFCGYLLDIIHAINANRNIPVGEIRLRHDLAAIVINKDELTMEFSF